MNRARLAMVIAACASTACLTPPGAGDAGVDSGNVVAACGTAAECACTNDSDCVLTRLVKDINSSADCYCEPCCDGVTNASAAAARRSGYDAYCSGFEAGPWPDGGRCRACSVSCPANQAVCDDGVCNSGPPR